jgi:hypothetical protein
MLKTIRSPQVYRALHIAAEKMSSLEYARQFAEWKKTHKTMKGFRFNPTSEHRQLVSMMIDQSIDDETCMLFLHHPEVMKQRFSD